MTETGMVRNTLFYFQLPYKLVNLVSVVISRTNDCNNFQLQGYILDWKLKKQTNNIVCHCDSLSPQFFTYSNLSVRSTGKGFGYVVPDWYLFPTPNVGFAAIFHPGLFLPSPFELSDLLGRQNLFIQDLDIRIQVILPLYVATVKLVNRS